MQTDIIKISRVQREKIDAYNKKCRLFGKEPEISENGIFRHMTACSQMAGETLRIPEQAVCITEDMLSDLSLMDIHVKKICGGEEIRHICGVYEKFAVTEKGIPADIIEPEGIEFLKYVLKSITVMPVYGDAKPVEVVIADRLINTETACLALDCCGFGVVAVSLRGDTDRIGKLVLHKLKQLMSGNTEDSEYIEGMLKRYRLWAGWFSMFEGKIRKAAGVENADEIMNLLDGLTAGSTNKINISDR